MKAALTTVIGLMTVTSFASAQSEPTPPSGVVFVDPSLRKAIVDGEYQPVVGGKVTVPCGRHRLVERDDVDLEGGRRTRAVLRKAWTIDVPCGGVAWVAPRSSELLVGSVLLSAAGVVLLGVATVTYVDATFRPLGGPDDKDGVTTAETLALIGGGLVFLSLPLIIYSTQPTTHSTDARIFVGPRSSGVLVSF